VAHARITPLRVAGHLVPEVLSERLAADTDDAGRATLAGVSPADLDAVCMEGEGIGVQWAGLPAQGRDKIVLLSLAPVGRVQGRLSIDGIPAEAGTLTLRAVARRTLRFTTWQMPGDEYSGGGMAEAVTDEEGKFDIPMIAAGSLTFEVGEDGLPSPSPETSTAAEDHPPDKPPAPPTDEPFYLAAQTTGPPAVDQ
jgi:hypothetical protein